MDFLLLKSVHELSAIAALGANFTYFIWLGLASKNPQMAPLILRTIQMIDRRVANPSYFMVAVSGALLIFVGPWSFKTPWVALSIAVFIVVGGLGGPVLAPTFRKQLALAEGGETDSPNYKALSRRGFISGGIVSILVIGIVYLMVIRPSLWG